MTYNESLSPLFSFVAHLAEAEPEVTIPGAAITSVGNDILILASAFLAGEASDLGVRREALFAFAAWASDRLSAVPAVADEIRRVLELPSAMPDRFVRRLETLLGQQSHKFMEDTLLEVLEVYEHCLWLGFTRITVPDALIKELRMQLRSRPGRIPRHSPPRLSFSQAVPVVLWGLPVYVTIILYAIYRLLLADLYTNVLG